MKVKEKTLSKTIKIPIPGIQYSNKQVSVTVVYSGDVDINKATDEINRELTILKDNDPEWVRGKEVQNGETLRLGY